MAEAEPSPAPELIKAPADGVPPLVDTPDALAAARAALVAGHGPLGVDTERAQSFRYSAKAYLIQLRREGAGTFLIDPVAFEAGRPRADLSPLAEALADVEWILHAASQDLPCLAEVGLLPRALFDTELGGRLLGYPRVALSALTERGLGKTLAKEHSAADWSRRPLPQDWLSYAALDVELLADLRDFIDVELETAGKSEWARQEFAYRVAHAGDEPHRRIEPWRRTSGLHDLRSPLQLAIVREFWTIRDQISERADRAPGRVLPDKAIVELAAKASTTHKHLTRADLRSVTGFGWRIPARYESSFVAALDRVAEMPGSELPPLRLQPEGPPPPRTWSRAFPEAFERWNKIRPATLALAEKHQLPVENLMAPDTVRRLAFDPPADCSEAGVDAFCAAHDARAWQRALVVPAVTPLLAD